MKWTLMAALALAGCYSSLPPAKQAQRQACLARVELEWDEEADRLCPPASVYWDECEHAGALELALQAEQERCTAEAHGR
jgi:hypothetical protein